MASSCRKVCIFAVRTKTGGLHFWISKMCFFRALCFQDPCGQSAKTMENMRFRKRVFLCGQPLIRLPSPVFLRLTQTAPPAFCSMFVESSVYFAGSYNVSLILPLLPVPALDTK